MVNHLEGYQQYRSRLTHALTSLRQGGQKEEAKAWLKHVRSSAAYKVAKTLQQKPDLSHVYPDEECGEDPDLCGSEKVTFGFYRSNEFYGGLANAVYNLGGVGLAVGSDQGLDFFTMANLNEMYCIDIDPCTQVVTRAYLEIGLRLKKMLGRCPTTDEYIEMFQQDVLPVTISLLGSPSKKHTFSQHDIDWLENMHHKNRDQFCSYLSNKREYYGESSWIGTDEALEHTIEAYQQGKIRIIQANIVGDIIPKLSGKIQAQGQKVSLVYLSNAPVLDYPNDLKTLKKLPLTDSSIFIFSQQHFTENGTRTRMPLGFEGIQSWQIVVFSPLGRHDWPTSRNSTYKEIAPGCYKIY